MSESPTEFTAYVDGVGPFTFSKRNMRLEFKIHAEYARLTEGVAPVPQHTDVLANAVSALKVLTVQAPDGWDLDEMDPLEDSTYTRLMAVFGALRAREAAFRARPAADGKDSGADSKPVA